MRWPSLFLSFMFWNALGLQGKEGVHWAFIAPQHHTPPVVKQADWPKNPIDRFILAETGIRQPQALDRGRQDYPVAARASRPNRSASDSRWGKGVSR